MVVGSEVERCEEVSGKVNCLAGAESRTTGRVCLRCHRRTIEDRPL